MNHWQSQTQNPDNLDTLCSLYPSAISLLPLSSQSSKIPQTSHKTEYAEHCVKFSTFPLPSLRGI